MFSLENKVALIAGGTRGVGLEIALTLARMGARLALNYGHNDEAGARALKLVREIEPKSILLKADLEDEEQTRAMVRRAGRDLGGLDIFIMNAVSTTTKSLLTVKPHSFWRTMAMNVGGFLISAQELSELISDGGRIVLISGIQPCAIQRPRRKSWASPRPRWRASCARWLSRWGRAA
jgi:NAD(P)-dependent dehydrogenase (short-subunit alcohol dehydrogenase family)